MRVSIDFEDNELYDLRALLEQTARPGSLQSRLIQRIDVKIEEAKRERYPSRRRPPRGQLLVSRA